MNSSGYVQAVAAVAGFATYAPSVDDDSVDLGFAMQGGLGTIRSPRLEAQLKCTDRPLGPGALRLPLKLKNYDDLRPTDLLVPRVLIVVRVPKGPPARWLGQSEERLALLGCGYWLSLRGRGPSPAANTAAVSVTVPRGNVFSAEALEAIMGRIASGEMP